MLAVWRLDRLGRNLQDLIGFGDDLKHEKVQFESLTAQTDTFTAMGRLIFQIFGTLAEYERALTPEKLSTAQALMRDLSTSMSQIRRTVGIDYWSRFCEWSPARSTNHERCCYAREGSVNQALA